MQGKAGRSNDMLVGTKSNVTFTAPFVRGGSLTGLSGPVAANSDCAVASEIGNRTLSTAAKTSDQRKLRATSI